MTLQRKFDLDGDQYDDVLMEQAGTNVLIYSDMNAGVSAGLKALGPMIGNFRLVGTADVDINAISDIVVQDPATGQVYAALMQPGGTFFWHTLSAFNVVGGGVDFHAMALGNFEGTQTTDILFQNQTDGAVVIGEALSSQTHVLVQATGPLKAAGVDYRVVGAGNVMGDNSDDIILQDQVSGTVIARSGDTNVYTVLANNLGGFKVVGVGDINGDGFADLVIQQASGGDTYFVNTGAGANVFGVVANGVGTLHAMGVVDVDHDGKGEVLFQDPATSEVFYRHVGVSGNPSTWGVAAGHPGADFHLA